MQAISAASTDQAQLASGVTATVVQMDDTTQQNAGLVEEMAAAAASLRGRAQDLVRAVSAFKEEAADAIAGRGTPVLGQAAHRGALPGDLRLA
jgi:methyl-accepting chemotaxis protein